MWKYTVKRILWMIPVLLGISIVIFTIMYFCPGDPAVAILGNGATPAAIEAKRIETTGCQQMIFLLQRMAS